MSIKLTCTKIHTNQSNAFPDYFGYVRSNNDTSLLVSPLVVAGIVIGLVLFLSCVTIIIGSLRKDGGVRDWRMEADPSYDGISYAVPVGDLRSVCTGDLTPSFECGSYLDFNVAYMDSPPCFKDTSLTVNRASQAIIPRHTKNTAPGKEAMMTVSGMESLQYLFLQMILLHTPWKILAFRVI
ncbi:protein BEAN1 isoform X2 [Pelobates fuscus]|uniref:protein BEAN1 isoform X2 n=1 Tax=Pelobates fuscus TaxID=191477 RepID=UPI002FE4F44C